MGAYLSEPLTDKHSETLEDNRFHAGSSSMQGWRVSQEVSHVPQGGMPRRSHS